MFEMDSIALSKLRLENAKVDCDVADDNFKLGHYKAANNRAYYAIFHSIRAVLALDNAEFKSHATMLGHFNKHYIHTRVFDRNFSTIIKDTNRARTNSDYNDMFKANREKTEKILNGAKHFYQAVESYLIQRWEKHQIQENIVNQDIEKLHSKGSFATGNTVTIKIISESLEEKISENTNKMNQNKSAERNTKNLAIELQEMKNFKAMADKVNDRNYPIKISGVATAENIMAQKVSIGKQISNIRTQAKESNKNIETER